MEILTSQQRDRLDRVMVARGLAESRARAQDLIRRGLVRVKDAVERSPGRQVAPADPVDVAATHAIGRHVSRGGEKLAAALEHFALPAEGRTALDIGASTGGFTGVLLDAGAARVHAVDVGHGQLRASLREDRRVVVHERCDARNLDATLIPDAIGIIVADVSFISLTKVLPAALRLARSGAWLVALVKPQFEAGRAALSKQGIVRDAAARERAVATVTNFIADQPGWRVLGIIPSPITGGSGNQEYLLAAVLDDP
jgi:23S rRNA (cytidine1920-2'-O)/16S rRNA (cytidine1409-2'-O)-methyltransferase